MKEVHFINLNIETIDNLKRIAHFKTYSSNSTLHYEGQTPIVAYLIIEGNILLTKDDQIRYRLSKGSLVGCQELILNTPSVYTAEILSNTVICYLDRSVLLEIKNSKNPKMKQVFLELANNML